MRLVEFEEAQGRLEKSTQGMESLRIKLSQSYKDVPGLFRKSPKGNWILSAEAIETIRKVKPKGNTIQDYEDVLMKALYHRFRIKVTPAEALDFGNYLAKADGFSPGLYLGKREIIDFSQARFGVISADFKGQNARNLEETLKAIADTEGRPMGERIQAVRKGEEAATASLEQKKKNFCEAIKKVFPHASYCGQFSGDDGIFFPDQAVSPALKLQVQKEWLKLANPEDARMTFTPTDYLDKTKIPTERLSPFVVDAETVEKDLRGFMIENDIPRELVNNLQMVIDFLPSQSGRHRVGVYFAGKENLSDFEKLKSQTLLYLKEKGYEVEFVEQVKR